MDDLPEFLTVAEVASLLRMPARTVTRLLKEGQLPGVYGGTRAGWRVRRADVANWQTNRPSYSYLRLPTPEEVAALRASETKARPIKRTTKRAKKTQEEPKE